MRIAVPPSSEADVLERLCGVPIQARCLTIVSPTTREVTARDPRPRPVPHGRHLLEHGVRSLETLLGLVEAAPLEQRPAEHEVRLADLVREVLAPLEQRERLARVLVGGVVVGEVQVHRREAAERLRRVRLRLGLDGQRERRLEVVDRLLRLAEQRAGARRG